MSAAETTQPGIDARALWALLAQPWRELHRVPPMSWLAPLPAVHVLHADGSDSLWLGKTRQSSDARQRAAAPFVAVELPRDAHLELPIKLPAMSQADREDALALEVRAASPFDPADLAWGWRETPDGLGVTVALASRRAVQSQLDAQASRLNQRGQPEVWAFDSQGLPVVLQGYGEAARQRQAARGRLGVWLLLLLALLLLAAIAVTPTVQLKLRAMQAVRAYAEIEKQLGPVLVQREALVKAQGQRDALRELMAERIEPLAVLDLVTQAVPDDTWVQRLQLQGSKLTLSGPTPNAAALMNRLSSVPQVRDVKAPTAATRAQGGRENYAIELTLLPEALRPETGAIVGGSATAPVAAATAVAAPLPTAVASAPAASPPAVTPAPLAASATPAAPTAVASTPAQAPSPPAAAPGPSFSSVGASGVRK